MRPQKNRGGTLRFSLVASDILLKNNATRNVTINPSKTNLVFVSLEYTNDLARQKVVIIENGVMTELSASGDSFGVVTVSGNTVTLKGTNASLYSAFFVVEVS